MIDPLTALGVASNILQLVELGGKVAGDAHRFYKSADGALEENVSIERVTLDLQQLCAKLASDARIDAFHWRESERKLQEVARECEAPAHQLISVLNELKSKGSGRFKTWQALRIAVKNVRKKGEVEGIQRRLDSMVSSVSLHLLRVLNDKASSICFDIQQLSRLAKEISQDTRTQLLEARSELITAVSKSQSHLASQTLARSAASSQQSRMKPNTATVNQQVVDDILAKLQQLASAAGVIATPQAITKSLSFKEMPMRHVQIPESYGRTNSWIFDSSQCSFPAWLKNSTGVFWINGKAGSGKSTLVKFLVDHPSTRALLEKWAGVHSSVSHLGSGTKLAVASFYFWKSGYPMQKSLQGLLQSILFYIFTQCPNLVSVVCHERWQKDDEFHRNPRPWTITELSNTLDALLQLASWPSHFCFFIDGLDEYVGSADDHYTLVEILNRLAAYRFAKVCVSSRPWNVFRVAYDINHAQTLVLQDHNKKDLDAYISGKLEKDLRFCRLAQMDTRAYEFAIEIRNRANGVFLWVFLVVRSLLDGLTEDDDVPMLQQRLRALPPTLEDYFRHMLKSIDSSYKQYTARALLLASNATQPLSILSYFYLEKEINSPGYALDAPIAPAVAEDMEKRKQRVVSWVNKWCRDLLEVNERPSLHTFTDPVQRYSVDFIHRTARDFLVMEDMQRLFETDAGPKFNVRLSLCRSYLAQVKHLSKDSSGADFLNLAGFLMYHAKEHEAMDQKSPIRILNELDRVGVQTAQYFKSEHWSSACPRFDQDNIGRVSSFLAYSVEFDLQLYVTDALERMNGPMSDDLASSLFIAATKPNLKHDVFQGQRSPLTHMLALLPHSLGRGQSDAADFLEFPPKHQLMDVCDSDNGIGIPTTAFGMSIKDPSPIGRSEFRDIASSTSGDGIYSMSQPTRTSFLSSMSHPGLSQSRAQAMSRYGKET